MAGPTEKVRAKFRCDSAENGEVVLRAVGSDETPENQRYHAATPVGEISLQVDNPTARDFFQAQAHYYIDFTRAGSR